MNYKMYANIIRIRVYVDFLFCTTEYNHINDGIYYMYRQGSHRDGKTWEVKMVMEKPWNFVFQSWKFYQFCPQFVLNLYFFGYH